MDEIPTKQYETICKSAFEKNDIAHETISSKLDLLLERNSKVRGQLVGIWWILGGIGALFFAAAKVFWTHLTRS